MEQIKQTTLEHNIQILTKKTIREQDKHILEAKGDTHSCIMAGNDKMEYKLDR